MKQYIRSRVARASSFVEIYLSIMIVLGILIVSVSLVKDVAVGVQNLFHGKLEFDYEAYLGLAFKLIIGIEFVKMISKHTPESTIDVLLFAIARKIIIDEPGYFDIIIGILAIAILFCIKKFLYTPNISDPQGFVLEADTPVEEANSIAKTNISHEYGKTLNDIVIKELQRQRKGLQEGVFVKVDNTKLKIYSIQNNQLDKIEVIPVRDNLIKKTKRQIERIKK